MRQTFETARLILKPIDQNDQQFIYQQFSNEIINQYLFDAEPLVHESEALDIIQFYTETKPKYQERFIMQLKDALTPIGTLGYHALNQHAMTIDIGYDLNPNYWGHGYMREALSFLIDHMRHTFKGYHIHACIYKDNIKSIAAVKHFGFTFEKDYDEIFRGKPYKHHIYRLDASKKVML